MNDIFEPDRWERIAQENAWGSGFVDVDDVINILREEHTWAVEMVGNELNTPLPKHLSDEHVGGYRSACAQILSLLEQRAK